MVIDPARSDFLVQRRNAVLATIRRDGSPALSPVWFRWSDDAFTISVGLGTAKYANLVRDGRVSLCIDDEAGGRYAVASGRVEWLDPAVERTHALDLVAKYLPAEEVKPYWRTIEVEQRQRLFRLRPAGWVWRGF
jgi:PPOX class probable F420-dependent enzyme